MSVFPISGKHTHEMYARLLLTLSVRAILSNCVTVNLRSQTPDIISKSKVELTPILFTSGLNDIIILSAPIVNADAVYYLHRPNGDAVRLKFDGNKTVGNFRANAIHNYQNRIFNANNGSCCNKTHDVFASEEAKMKDHDFMIGPLQEEDNGNWVLSVYFVDVDEHWIELFQVITIEIIEQVPLSPDKSQLNLGETYILGFAYPITDLQSCQIDPPESTIDRFYDRTKTGFSKCEFIMKNVTLADAGTWTIIAVGRVVYKGTASLHVGDKRFR